MMCKALGYSRLGQNYISDNQKVIGTGSATENLFKQAKSLKKIDFSQLENAENDC
jgi:hypothetical protein